MGRLEDWNEGKMAELVQCTIAKACHGSGGKKADNKESISRTYHSMVAQGKLHSAIRVATICDGGIIYLPDDTATMLGR